MPPANPNQQVFGENVLTGFSFPLNQKVTMKMEVVMNTITNGIANPDGEFRLWVNGIMISNRTNMRWMEQVTPEIDICSFEYFYGGSGNGTSVWAPPNETCARVCDICYTGFDDA